jgi:hypothetical protein
MNSPSLGIAFDPDQLNERERADAYAAELRYYRPRGFAAVARDLERADLEFDYDAMHDADELLTEWARRVTRNPYIVFGPFPHGGAVGFYVDADSAVDDADLQVDDMSEVPRGFSGLVVHVNDHGNVTAYRYSRGRSRELFAVV